VPGSLKTTAGCEERSRLLKAYNDVTREFSDSLSGLNARIGVTPKREYDLLEHAVEDARLKSEQARIAYERHISPIMAADLPPPAPRGFQTKQNLPLRSFWGPCLDLMPKTGRGRMGPVPTANH
jgi:hypothetical protein